MDYAQEQDEEREVLLSIYEEDDRFKEVDTTTFQYKFGDDSHLKSFVLEIKWTKDYPENAPDVNLSAFYNKHINDQVKRFIVSKLLEQCELNLGCAMTYTLLDWTNEHFNELTEGQSEVPQQTVRLILSNSGLYEETVYSSGTRLHGWGPSPQETQTPEKKSFPRRKKSNLYVGLINRAGGLYRKILTEVVKAQTECNFVHRFLIN